MQELPAPPDVPGLAADVHYKAATRGGSQAILITGELSSGKGDVAKHVISYFATASRLSSLAAGLSNSDALPRALQDSTALLSAFTTAAPATGGGGGDSRALRSFALAIDSPSGVLVGAHIRSTLLDAWRVSPGAGSGASQGGDWRGASGTGDATHRLPCFRVLYQLVAGVTGGDREALRLRASARHYRILSGSPMGQQAEAALAGEFAETVAALTRLHLGPAPASASGALGGPASVAVLRLLAGVLALSEVHIAPAGEAAAAHRQHSHRAPARVSPSSAGALADAAHLLGVPAELLAAALLSPPSHAAHAATGGGDPSRGATVGEARAAVDGLCCGLYRRLVSHLVGHANGVLAGLGDACARQLSSAPLRSGQQRAIGTVVLVDSPGFSPLPVGGASPYRAPPSAASSHQHHQHQPQYAHDLSSLLAHFACEAWEAVYHERAVAAPLAALRAEGLPVPPPSPEPFPCAAVEVLALLQAGDGVNALVPPHGGAPSLGHAGAGLLDALGPRRPAGAGGASDAAASLAAIAHARSGRLLVPCGPHGAALPDARASGATWGGGGGAPAPADSDSAWFAIRHSCGGEVPYGPAADLAAQNRTGAGCEAAGMRGWPAGVGPPCGGAPLPLQRLLSTRSRDGVVALLLAETPALTCLGPGAGSGGGAGDLGERLFPSLAHSHDCRYLSECVRVEVAATCRVLRAVGSLRVIRCFRPREADAPVASILSLGSVGPTSPSPVALVQPLALLRQMGAAQLPATLSVACIAASMGRDLPHAAFLRRIGPLVPTLGVASPAAAAGGSEAAVAEELARALVTRYRLPPRLAGAEAAVTVDPSSCHDLMTVVSSLAAEEVAAALGTRGAPPPALVRVGAQRVFVVPAYLSRLEAALATVTAETHAAACSLQRGARAMVIRRRYVRAVRGVTALQARLRAYLTRRAVGRLLRAAASLSRWWRHVYARRRFVAMRRAALAVQTAHRRRTTLATASVAHEGLLCLHSLASGALCGWLMVRACQAAGAVQAAVRRWLARRRHEERRQAGALVLQRLWRGHACRSRHHLVVAALNSTYWRLRLSSAARRLAAAWRRRLVRAAFLAVRGAVVTLQTWWRGVTSRRRVSRLQAAARAVQAVYRGHQARKHAARARSNRALATLGVERRALSSAEHAALDDARADLWPAGGWRPVEVDVAVPTVLTATLPKEAYIAAAASPRGVTGLSSTEGHTRVRGLGGVVAALRSVLVAAGGAPLAGFAVGTSHAVACTGDGAAWAWGEGVGMLSSVPRLLRLPHPQLRVVSVAAGSEHILLMVGLAGYSSASLPSQLPSAATSGELDAPVWALGRNAHGECGVGHLRPVTTPTPITAGLPRRGQVRSVAAGGNTSVFLSTTGTVFACGRIAGAQAPPLALPAPVRGLPARCEDVSCGVEHCLVLARGGEVWAWGGNSAGQCGVPRAATSAVWPPVRVDVALALQQQTRSPQGPEVSASFAAAQHAVVSVAAGGRHSVALTAAGKAAGWGSDACGQLGGSGGGHMPRMLRQASAEAHMRLERIACGSASTYGVGGLRVDSGVGGLSASLRSLVRWGGDASPFDGETRGDPTRTLIPAGAGRALAVASSATLTVALLTVANHKNHGSNTDPEEDLD